MIASHRPTTYGNHVARSLPDNSSKEVTIRIAVLDYLVVKTNPIGGCHRRMLEGLADEHDFTVFAVQFDNPRPDRIRFVRVPVPIRPLAVLFVAFHVVAPLVYWVHRLRHRVRFDLVQKVESNLLLGDVAHSQFSHRSFLRLHWSSSRPGGLRRPLRWLDHRLHAVLEPMAYRRASRIVVCSQGLAAELTGEHSQAAAKLRVVDNPVDLAGQRRPASFVRAVRQELGFGPGDMVLVFVALGQFERKGLPLLLEAIREIDDRRLKLLVVGGEPDLVDSYRTRTARLGLEEPVRFVGSQRDVRPYLWSADALAFPSSYEAHSLVVLEAAAASLPVLVTPLNGVSEWARDGENAVVVDRSPEGVADGLRRLLDLPPARLAEMGDAARHSVEGYSVDDFVEGWRRVYAELRAPT